MRIALVSSTLVVLLIWGFSPVPLSGQSPCMQFTLPSVPFSTDLTITAPNAAGDRLIVGTMGAGYFASIPLPNAINQKLCDTQQLAPGVFAEAYVPTPAERAGDFHEFAGLLIDPLVGLPFTGGIIPASRLGSFGAWRVGAMSFTQQFGSSYMDSAHGAAADGGGVYVAGGWGEGSNPFLRKYDSNGALIWSRRTWAPSVSDAYGVAAGSTGIYSAGYIDAYLSGPFPGQTSIGRRDAYICRYSDDGVLRWIRQFGTTEFDEALGAAVDATAVYVVGRTSGTFPGQSNSGYTDVFVRKYGADGTEVWTRQFGTSANDQAHGVVVDETGVYVSGSAAIALPGQSNSGAFVRKYSSEGSELWTRQLGSGSSAFAIAGDTAGIYVVGSGTIPGQIAAGGGDAFVRKYDADGTEVWTRQIGTSGFDDARGVAVDATGVYVVGRSTGTFSGQTNSGLHDVYARKYGIDGTEIWTHQFGSSGDDVAFGVAVSDVGIYVAGLVGDGASLPGQTSAGGWDAFFAGFPKTAQNVVEAIQKEVGALETTGTLNQGQAGSLLSKLDNALRLLNEGRTRTGCNLLRAFINQVNDFIATGIITADEGNHLIILAQETRNLAPCEQ